MIEYTINVKHLGRETKTLFIDAADKAQAIHKVLTTFADDMDDFVSIIIVAETMKYTLISGKRLESVVDSVSAEHYNKIRVEYNDAVKIVKGEILP